MSITTAMDSLCQYCGRPVIGQATWGLTGPYHPECCRGPSTTPSAVELELEEMKRRIDALERIFRAKSPND